jgi:hypothetical protein
MHPRTARLGFAAALAAALAVPGLRLPPAVAGGAASVRKAEALQEIADIVLIESECRAFTVDYGALFAFAERNGIDPLEIMPTGPRRPAFDAALRRRARAMKGAALCGAFAAEREAAFPGILMAR